MGSHGRCRLVAGPGPDGPPQHQGPQVEITRGPRRRSPVRLIRATPPRMVQGAGRARPTGFLPRARPAPAAPGWASASSASVLWSCWEPPGSSSEFAVPGQPGRPLHEGQKGPVHGGSQVAVVSPPATPAGPAGSNLPAHLHAVKVPAAFGTEKVLERVSLSM